MSACVSDRSVWVVVDQKGAVCRVEMPDGTELPEVQGVELEAYAGEVQRAKVSLMVRVRQDGAQKQS